MTIHNALLADFPAERVLTRALDLAAYASDASFYHLLPRAVVFPVDIGEVQQLFRISQEHRVPLVFRAAGTSLSGQSITDGILVHIGKHWKVLEVLDGGKSVRVGPGVIGAQVNTALRQYSAKIGPDPASIGACMVGGIIANNSSGMCCGVQHNSYHTIESLVFVLPNGTCINTADADADEQFHRVAPSIAQGLLYLKGRIEQQPVLRDRIRAKYHTKNTTGYSLNAFLDYTRAVDIMAHLLVGSEGTLGFIAEAVFRTVPDKPWKYTGLLFFPTVAAACAGIEPLQESGAAALELLDRASLRAVQGRSGVPALLATLPDTAAALLVEYHASTESERHTHAAVAEQVCQLLPLLHSPEWTTDVGKQAQLWSIRKGLLPSVGAVRQSGTTVVIEDVAFPVKHLANAVVELQVLFAKHGYNNAIIFGHAKDGNLHFVITQSFNNAETVTRYEQFVADLVELVVHRYDGALKAEHGTGRNMAPFVETEWGAEAYVIMKELKQCIDPKNLLNPDVIINNNPRAHLANLKTLPPVEREVDMCIECGYCETVCPSRNLTTTPRQRIALRREMARRTARGDTALPERDIAYSMLDTCAADGLCGTACPVGINTGELVQRLRAERHATHSKKIAEWIARNSAIAEFAAKMALHSGRALTAVLGVEQLNAGIRFMERRMGIHLPKWSTALPKPRREGVPTYRYAQAEYVYFSSCINRIMGSTPAGEEQPLIETLLTLSARAGVSLAIVEEPRGLCCGMPWFSKGFQDTGRVVLAAAVQALWQHSKHGRLPIVVDMSSCAYEFISCSPLLDGVAKEQWQALTFLDAVEFGRDVLLPRLPIRRRVPSVALHPVCSLRKRGLTDAIVDIARACADTVVVPQHVECCGMAGDRGLLFPELTASATRAEANDIAEHPCDMYLSSNTPCETAMTAATGRQYVSWMYVVERATKE